MKTYANRPQILVSSGLFFIFSVLTLTAVRCLFFEVYRSDELGLQDFLPAFLIGLRVDAKWLAIALVPAWVFIVLSLWKDFFYRIALFLAGIACSLLVLLDIVNFGFFGFYRTPISSIIFGLFQDDTKAILETIWDDWPVFLYVSCFAALAALPFLMTALVGKVLPSQPSVNRKREIVAVILFSVALMGAIRGSLGTFPLRVQDFSVSPVPFVNATVPNGAAALYEAYKAQKALTLQGPPESAFAAMGFRSKNEAVEILKSVRKKHTPNSVATQPHVVLAVMGRDMFEAHRTGMNDTLGRLAGELSEGYVFLNGISVANGTFVSLEGILFDTPFSPLTQSKYSRREFEFSKVRIFKEAGYRTIFLTAGPEGWRQMDENFPRQGFDQIIGSAALRAQYPDAEELTWGIGDEWMFRAAESLISEADQKGEKLFLVMLSATNHGPHRVPDQTPSNPVSADFLPPFLTSDRTSFNLEEIRTYQYSANALGGFVHRIRSNDGKGRGVLIAATGDHNGRYQYNPDGYWHHAFGVPLLFWLPKSMEDLRSKADPQKFVGHRDLFPTLTALALGRSPELHEGRNLFASHDVDMANSFACVSKDGFAVGAAGAVILHGGKSVACYKWERDRLIQEKKCSPELKLMGDVARAERAMADYTVRKGLDKSKSE